MTECVHKREPYVKMLMLKVHIVYCLTSQESFLVFIKATELGYLLLKITFFHDPVSYFVVSWHFPASVFIFQQRAKHLFMVPFFKAAFKTLSSRAACTFRLAGRQPVKPLALASSGHSPSQPPNQQASLFMRACYCWAVFRNKRKLKSLAVRRHPELKEAGGDWGRGGMKGRNSCHSPLVFSRFLKRQLSRLCEWSEQREGKLKRAAGGREPHSWEDASPTNRPETLGLSV